MRNKISLYIADQLVDLDEQSFILFNYTMEDLGNPTIVRNSFSKQITLPGTPNNNKIFGSYYKVDRITRYNGNSGVNFNAMYRTSFVMYDEKNSIVESGYCKLDKVNTNKGRVEYAISLYGNLGLFFYGLKNKEDGTPITLADLTYHNAIGNVTDGSEIRVVDGATEVSDCWKYLEDNNYKGSVMWSNIVNFAPCYNGIPSGFSADKTIKDNYWNVPSSRTIDGVTYSMKSGVTHKLSVFSNPHTEWEMHELRWYLQRPIVSIRAIFEAISMKENNGGFEVVLDPSFFNENNHIYWDGWITLPMISLENRNEPDVLIKVLKSSLSPADYLVSFAKMTGLVFLIDKAFKKVTITTRQKFFSQNGDIIDLTERINKESISIIPHLSDSRIYEFGNENIGEWAASYRERYGKKYGIMRVNTGNEFSSETKVVTEDIKFKSAVDVQEQSLLYYTDSVVPPSPTITKITQRYLRIPLYESVKTQLWNKENMMEIDVLADFPDDSRYYADNKNYPGADWLPKVQLHDADNKDIDGSNVLLIFNQVMQVPWHITFNVSSTAVTLYSEYELTKDHPDMDILNEGAPCWGGEVVETLLKLPSFRRSYVKTPSVPELLDWGLPEEWGVLKFAEVSDDNTLYGRFWNRYQRDRYDDDTIRLTCKADLRGLEVGQNLLGRFFYYQGAIFVLNAIRDHSLTTYDDTECEFVRVQDINNYTE